MTHSPDVPTLIFYARDGCHLCDEARADLQAVLEDRVKRGEPIARVRVVDIDTQPRLQRALQRRNSRSWRCPAAELPLAMGRRTIDRFSEPGTRPARLAAPQNETLELTLAAALIAGFVSFISPCVLPVVPAYLGQIGIVSAAATATATVSPIAGPRVTLQTSRWRVMPHAIAFVFGFGPSSRSSV